MYNYGCKPTCPTNCNTSSCSNSSSSSSCSNTCPSPMPCPTPCPKPCPSPCPKPCPSPCACPKPCPTPVPCSTPSCNMSNNNAAIANCNAYKQKADDLYAQAACLKDQANAAFCESEMLLCEAKALEDKLKEIVQMANCKCQEGNQAQQQASYLLDLASNASQQAADCFKQANQSRNCQLYSIDIVPVTPSNNCNCTCNCTCTPSNNTSCYC